ncbi:RBP11-like subunits of RNA polymerase [Hyaloraphidium curvatum]|nr:RBP11-like subunits of RNA polymerase [Hyaloraphidium curvatum]
MNAPDRFEAFRVPDGEPKVRFVKDGKLPNAGTFVVRAEDHTIGNLLRMQLLKNSKVLFVGYRVPHPLEPYVEIKLQTTAEAQPAEVFSRELEALIKLVGDVRNKFENEATRFGISAAGAGYGRPGEYDDGF